MADIGKPVRKIRIEPEREPQRPDRGVKESPQPERRQPVAPARWGVTRPEA